MTSTLTPQPQTSKILDESCPGSPEHALFLESVLQQAEGDPGLKLHSVDVKPGSSIGDNYTSILTRIQASGEHSDGKSYHRSVMVKRVPSSASRRALFRCVDAFRREADAYSELLPALSAGCARARVPVPFAECLFAKHASDVIVLDDLAPRGFTMGDRRQGLDADHGMLAMEALGRFHGMSLALRRTDPEGYRRLRSAVSELIYCPEGEPHFARSVRASMTMAEWSLRDSGRADLADKIGARADGAFQDMSQLVQPPEEGADVEPVINHGDCWLNNMLFKYNEIGRVEDIRLLDLQVLRCSSPALDILHVLYTSLQDDVRVQHGDAFLRRYHRALVQTVNDLVNTSPVGSTVLGPEVASLESLQKEMKNRGAYGLWHGLWILPALVIDPKTIPNMDTMDSESLYSDASLRHWWKIMPALYHSRVVSIVSEYDNLGLL